MRAYLCGPLTETKEFTAFSEASTKLRALGHQVENPAENPFPACGTWEGYMRAAITQLMRCDCIVMLPGWKESHGTIIEAALADALSIDRMELMDFPMRARLSVPDEV